MVTLIKYILFEVFLTCFLFVIASKKRTCNKLEETSAGPRLQGVEGRNKTSVNKYRINKEKIIRGI